METFEELDSMSRQSTSLDNLPTTWFLWEQNNENVILCEQLRLLNIPHQSSNKKSSITG